MPDILFELNEEEIHRGDGMPLKVNEGEAFIAGIIIHLGMQHFTWLQTQAASFGIAGLTRPGEVGGGVLPCTVEWFAHKRL